MNPIGAAMEIQNTDAGHWLVTCNAAVTSANEQVSFTVAIPRSSKNLGAIQIESAERAIELLQSLVAQLHLALGTSSKN